MLSLSKTKIKPIIVSDTLKEKGIALFTPREFSWIFSTSPRKTRYFLETYTKQGLFVRLKKDLYALKDKMPNEEVIANALYRPSYISLEYALARHGIIPEMPYTVTSVTTKATASFDVLGKEFTYRKTKIGAYTGYAPEKVFGKTVFIAEPEKALADYLYFVSLGRKTFNDRTDSRRLNKNLVREYAKLYNRKTLDNLIDKVWALTPVIV